MELTRRQEEVFYEVSSGKHLSDFRKGSRKTLNSLVGKNLVQVDYRENSLDAHVKLTRLGAKEFFENYA